MTPRYVNYDSLGSSSSSDESVEEDHSAKLHPQAPMALRARLAKLDTILNSPDLQGRLQNMDLDSPFLPEEQTMAVTTARSAAAVLQPLRDLASQEARDFVESGAIIFVFPGQDPQKDYVWVWSRTRDLCRRDSRGGFIRGRGECKPEEYECYFNDVKFMEVYTQLYP